MENLIFFTAPEQVFSNSKILKGFDDFWDDFGFWAAILWPKLIFGMTGKYFFRCQCWKVKIPELKFW